MSRVKRESEKVLEEQPAKTNKLLKQIEKLETQSAEQRGKITKKRFDLFQKLDRSVSRETSAESFLMPKETNQLRRQARETISVGRGKAYGLLGLFF